MKKITIISKTAFILLSVFFSIVAYGQLPDFTVNATPTPAACGGTGSVVFTTTGASPQATITYSVYLLPNTTTPILVTTTPSASSLGAGNYMVQATQTLGALSNTAPPEYFIIENIAVTPTVIPVQTKAICNNDGAITVNLTGGTGPFTYALYAGTSTVNPIVLPQSSNVFNNLAAGSYTVRVTDGCGTVNNYFTIVEQTPVNVIPGSMVINSGALPGCNSIEVIHNFSGQSGGVILYPLTFTFTVTNPNGGAPTIVSQIITGEPNEIVQQIPFYNNQQYSYSLTVTDACGNMYTRNNNTINAGFIVTRADTYMNCNDNVITFTPNNYVAPYTISFTTAPPGFVPAQANAQHPVFSGDNAIYGENGGTVPEGTYIAQITDACGRTYTTPPLIVQYPEVDVVIDARAECGEDTGRIRAFFTISGRVISEIVLTDAPQAYKDLIAPEQLPKDVSSFITSLPPTTGLLMSGLPLGEYTFDIVDSCGETYTKTGTVTPVGGELDDLPDPLNRPGCTPGIGTIRIGNPASGPVLTSVIIESTDADMPGVTFPYDVSANIATNGAFYMADLPQGNYTFKVIGGDCGASTRLEGKPVIGYQPSTTDPVITPYCGSFSLNVNDTSNGDYAESVWLQKFNQDTQTWGHPATGAPYTEGTQPNSQNSVLVQNSSQLYPYSGKFRIIRVFFTFTTGSAINNRCTEVLSEFEIGAGPVITEVIALPCVNGTIEATIVATGVAPLTYKLYSSNGTFISDNGTSNLFTNMATGNYTVQVTDNCANMTPYDFIVTAPEPITIQSQGNFCEGQLSSLYVQNYSFLLYEWYRTNMPGVILSTTNILEFPAFDSATDPGEYTVHIYTANGSACLEQVLEPYTVNPNVLPNAGEDNAPVICNDGTAISLDSYLATGHNPGGVWTDNNNTGMLTGSTFTPAGILPGTYAFTYTVTDACGLTDAAVITITLKNTPQPPVIEAVAPVCEGGQVQLVINAPVAGGIYQWTGPDGFTSSDISPVLNNISIAGNGLYTVTVTENDCTSQPTGLNVTVNTVPAITIEGDIQLCNGQSGYLSAEGGNLAGTETYQWYYNNNLMQGVTSRDIQIFETGTYSAIATNNSCSSLQASIDVIKNETGFEILLDIGCRDDRYMVWVTNLTDLPEAVFAWTGPEGFTATGPEIDITGKAKGEYVVTVTNIQGCTASEEINITNTSCMIPKGVSPNNDGFNDTFDLTNLDVKHLIIYNRYGLKVYEANNYINEWHGQSDKGNLPTGTYYYVITLQSKTVTGWVYLQRKM